MTKGFRIPFISFGSPTGKAIPVADSPADDDNSDIAPGVSSAENDTLKVDRKLVALEAQQKRRVIIAEGNNSRPPTYGTKSFKFLVLLSIPEVVINFFEIPVFDEKQLSIMSVSGAKQRKGNVATYYDLVTKGGKTVTRDNTIERSSLVSARGVTKQSARLPLLGLYTPRQRNLSVSICFPYWFTKLMIGQALAGMIKKNAPMYWYSKDRKRYALALSEGALQAPITVDGKQSPHGAWLLDPTTFGKTKEEVDARYDGGVFEVSSTGGAMTRTDNKTLTAITIAPKS